MSYAELGTVEENWVDLVRHKLEFEHAEWEQIFDSDFDFEIVDTRLKDDNNPVSGYSPNERGFEPSRSPTMQASPQPQRPALQQIAHSAVQQLPVHEPPNTSPYKPSAGKLRAPSSSIRAHKRRRIETENMVYNVSRGPSRVLLTVPYDYPDLEDPNLDDEQLRL